MAPPQNVDDLVRIRNGHMEQLTSTYNTLSSIRDGTMTAEKKDRKWIRELRHLRDEALEEHCEEARVYAVRVVDAYAATDPKEAEKERWVIDEIETLEDDISRYFRDIEDDYEEEREQKRKEEFYASLLQLVGQLHQRAAPPTHQSQSDSSPSNPPTQGVGLDNTPPLETKKPEVTVEQTPSNEEDSSDLHEDLQGEAPLTQGGPGLPLGADFLEIPETKEIKDQEKEKSRCNEEAEQKKKLEQTKKEKERKKRARSRRRVSAADDSMQPDATHAEARNLDVIGAESPNATEDSQLSEATVAVHPQEKDSQLLESDQFGLTQGDQEKFIKFKQLDDKFDCSRQEALSAGVEEHLIPLAAMNASKEVNPGMLNRNRKKNDSRTRETPSTSYSDEFSTLNIPQSTDATVTHPFPSKTSKEAETQESSSKGELDKHEEDVAVQKPEEQCSRASIGANLMWCDNTASVPANPNEEIARSSRFQFKEVEAKASPKEKSRKNEIREVKKRRE